MKTKIHLDSRYLPGVLYAAVFAFWAFCYQGHVLFTEQLSLFLYSADYLREYVLQSGGWASLCGDFLSQFYINRWVGALLQTGLFAAMFTLARQVLRALGAGGGVTIAGVLPAILLLVLQMDYRFDPGWALTMIFPWALALVYLKVHRVVLRRVGFTLAIVPVFLLCGATATCCLYAACVVIELFGTKDKWRYATLVWPLAAAVLAHWWQTLYPAVGDSWFQVMDYPPHGIARHIPFVLLALLPAGTLAAKLAGVRHLRAMASSRLVTVALAVLMLACGAYLIPKTYRGIEENNLRMYLAVARGDWDGALKTAERVKTRESHSALLINLSLAMKGELPDRIFDYPQTDLYGLVPFRRIADFEMLLYGSEYFWHIGIPNEAIRWVFDSYITLKRGINYRTLVRLAEWNRKAGYMPVSEKYFDILEHTLMYRSWARRTRLESVVVHSGIPLDKEFWVGGREPLSDLIRHYEADPDNTLPIDYLLCGLLFRGDLDTFRQVYDALPVSAERMPKAYREAFTVMAEGGAIDPGRYGVSRADIARLQRFNQLVGRRDTEALEKDFGNTWWYYSARVAPATETNKPTTP